ncbi:hypothetical protein LguiA_029491 [Lonicera macranthoides]
MFLHQLNLGSTQQLQDQEANLGDQKPNNKYSPLATEQLPIRFSLPGILSATNNFDDSKVIGRGGFGLVYKGVLDNGALTVAIKRLNLESSKQGAIEFLTEIEMLPKFRHRNLISLIGYCDDCDEMIIVYEYMTRGALAGYLYKIDRSANNSVLSWVQRLKICLDAARGLEYLHTGTNVIHRDMKSSNILLDDNLTAKVSDFGMSKVGPKNDSCSHVSTQVKGTSGYLDPEYWMTHKLTKKSDVYSFGVVLLEVLSGKAAFDFERTEEQRSLVIWAQRCIKEETLNEIIDPSLTSEIVQPNSLASFIKIANQSVHHRSKKRPTMAEVVSSLESALALQERKDFNFRSDQQHREETNKTDQEIVDYSSKLHQITPSSNNRGKQIKSAAGISGNSWTITTAFTKIMRQVFLGKDRLSTNIYDPSAFVETTGPFGGQGGEPWDDGSHTMIRKLIIYSWPVIQSIQIEYDDNGQSKYSEMHGRKEGIMNTVELDYPHEFLVSVSGYVNEFYSQVVFHSITLESNKRTYGPFGREGGKYYKFPSTTGNKIIGFFGRSGYHLDSIGVYFEPPIKPVGPFGGQGRDSWDDGPHTAIVKLIIYSSIVIESIQIEYDDDGQPKCSGTHGRKEGIKHTVELDYPSEFLISVSGYIDELYSKVVVHSLTLESNERTYGPFGRAGTQCIKFPSTSGNKILGFFGSSGRHLDSLGAYFVKL